MTSQTKQMLENIFGILLLLLSFRMFAEGGSGIVGALFMIAGGLLCIPKTRHFIEQQFNFKFSKVVKIVVIAFGWLSIGIFSKPVSSNTDDSVAKTQPKLINNDTIVQVVDTPVTNSYLSTKVQEKNVTTENKQNFSSSTNKGKANKKRNSYSSGNSRYMRGPRGGCYYLSSNGKKVYVDHSYCN